MRLRKGQNIGTRMSMLRMLFRLVHKEASLRSFNRYQGKVVAVCVLLQDVLHIS